MAIKVNKITEFVKGVYGTVLDFPTKDFLQKVKLYQLICPVILMIQAD